MIQYASGGKETFKGKRVAISGSGNVAQYAALKCIELGATIISLSDSKGTLVATGEKGISPDEVAYIADLKVKRKQLTEIMSSNEHKEKFKYVEGARPWTHVGKVDVALPSATQNEVSGEEAQALIDAGAKFIAEGSNMGCSQEAIDIFEKHRRDKKGDAIWYAPGKSQRTQPQWCVRLITSNRQSRKRWRRCRLRSRDGPELPTHILVLRTSRREAEGHHGIMLQERAGDCKGIRGAGRGRVPQLGGREQHRRLQQGGCCHVRTGRLVVASGHLF